MKKLKTKKSGNDSKFKIGDAVQLKSGGPSMTVNDDYYVDKGVACSYFVGSNYKSININPSALHKLNPDIYDNVPEIKLGDVVRLKTGGPDMSVIMPLDDEYRFMCHWFVGSKLNRGVFLSMSLCKVEINAGIPPSNVGDVVQLNTGGPPMTVTDMFLGFYRGITCNWFDDKGNFEVYRYSMENLCVVE